MISPLRFTLFSVILVGRILNLSQPFLNYFLVTLLFVFVWLFVVGGGCVCVCVCVLLNLKVAVASKIQTK